MNPSNLPNLIKQAVQTSSKGKGPKKMPSFHSQLFGKKGGKKSKNKPKNKRGGGSPSKKWLKMPAGNWVVRVRAKNAAFSQRAKILTTTGRRILGQKPGSRTKFLTSDFWRLKIQNRHFKFRDRY